MSKTVVQTIAAPAAIGPYSQAICAGALLFVSGQIPLDPVTAQLAGQDIETQTRRVLDNLKAIVEAGGSTLADVVKTTIFLKDMNDFAKVNEIYGSYFKQPFPARATIEVARLPRDVRVEIECVAHVSE